jgi:hypothetical protein
MLVAKSPKKNFRKQVSKWKLAEKSSKENVWQNPQKEDRGEEHNNVTASAVPRT